MKKIQIGARITEEDAEFINLLEIEGAHTPSDKLRAIIEEAKLQREFSNDFRGVYKMIQGQLAPMVEKIKKTEFDNDCHSEHLARILEWLPEFYAFCLASLPKDQMESQEELQKYENGAINRIVRLVESLLYLELSAQKTSYNQNVLNGHVSSLSEIIRIINSKNQGD